MHGRKDIIIRIFTAAETPESIPTTLNQVREVSATCDGDAVSEADGSLVLPEILRPAPGETVKASVPGSSSPMSAKYFMLRRWARM